MWMFIVTLFIIAQNWKKPKCLWTEKWMNNEILHCNKMRETAKTCYNIDESQMHYS